MYPNSFSCVTFYTVFEIYLYLQKICIILRFRIGVCCIHYIPETRFREYSICCIKWHKISSYMELVRKSMFSTMGRKAFLFPLVFTLLDYFWACLTSAVTFLNLHESCSCSYQRTQSFPLDRKIYRSQMLLQGKLLETGVPAFSSLSPRETFPE